MAWQYTKHYTLEEARALLPQVRQWLEQLSCNRRQLSECEQRMAGRLGDGYDLGGETVNERIRLLADIKTLVEEFNSREIEIKDIERGLIDFPAVIGGREVFLCWEKDEEDIEFWHDLNTGYAGRERLE